MKVLEIRGNWNEIKGKLKQKYSQLTDDDLFYAEGKFDEMVGKMQKRLNKTKQQVVDLISRTDEETEEEKK